MNDALLRIDDLIVAIWRSGRLYPVLTGVTFALQRGEVLGLVGESGCGKSLTCRTVIGLLPPAARVTGGAVRFNGQNLLQLSERELTAVRRLHIAMIFQDPLSYLNPVLTIGSQLAEVAGERDARDRCLQALADAGLPDPEAVRRSYPHELSGGMRQRAMIAMALVRQPRVLIADEITTALDATTQLQVLDTLRSLQERMGLSVLLVTHDMGVAARACDRVAVMYAGQIVELADVRTIFERPLHPYTQALLAAHPRPGLDRLPYIEGEVPSYLTPPGGCPFHPRCPHVMPVCRTHPPSFGLAERDHGVACYLYTQGLHNGNA